MHRIYSKWKFTIYLEDISAIENMRDNPATQTNSCPIEVFPVYRKSQVYSLLARAVP